MKSLRRCAACLAALIVVGVTLASGQIHGRLSHRWVPPAELLEAQLRLPQVAKTCGDWRLQALQQLDAGTLRMLKCESHFAGVYVNQRTGDSISLAAVVGPLDTMWGHQPEFCYACENCRVRTERQRVTIHTGDGHTHELWSVVLQAGGVNGEIFRVLYGWSDGGSWEAPESARMKFGGRPYLYKLQLQTGARADFSDKNDSSEEFLKVFLPRLQNSLVAPTETVASAGQVLTTEVRNFWSELRRVSDLPHCFLKG